MYVCEFWQPVILELHFCYSWGSFLYWTWFRDYVDNHRMCFYSELTAGMLGVKVLGIESDFPCKQLIVPYRLICWDWLRILATLFGWSAEYATHITPPVPIYLESFVSCILNEGVTNLLFVFFGSFRGVTEIARWSVEYIAMYFWIITD